MPQMLKLIAFSKYSIPQLIGSPSLETIKNIKDSVRYIVNNHHTKPVLTYEMFDPSNCYDLKLEKEILVDSLAYLELLCNKNNQSFLKNPALKDQFIKDFFLQIPHARVNFDRSVHIGAKLLKLTPPPNYYDWVHQHPGFNNNPILRTQLDLFVNRGNYYWRPLGGSRFKEFLLNNQKDKLTEDATINCWEAMLYSLIRANAIDKKAVANLYYPGRSFEQILSELSKAFRWETAKHITSKDLFLKAGAYNPYFILIATKNSEKSGTADGLDHDMVSFPSSTDKILQTLISGHFQDKPDNQPNFYSHWTKWTDSRLGSPDNQEALNYMMKNKTHIIPLHVFIKKFPQISKHTRYALEHNIK